MEVPKITFFKIEELRIRAGNIKAYGMSTKTRLSKETDEFGIAKIPSRSVKDNCLWIATYQGDVHEFFEGTSSENLAEKLKELDSIFNVIG